MQNYFKELEDKVKVCYSVAEQARGKGLDPLSKVEVSLATSLAERVSGLVSGVYPQLSDPKIPKRIIELEKQFGALDPAVALQIAEEIAKEKFCKFKSLLEAIEAGIRVGIAYMTLGVVSSPIEGFTYVKLKKTRRGNDYFSAYFSGPIRSAGGTAAAFSLIIIDYLRELFNFARYDPLEEEVKRTITELYDYHERITNLQYLPTEEEIEFLARNLPVQVGGEPSESKEVSNYKDLERVETNLIRGGFCLVIGEGIAQKAPKIWRMVKGLREKGFKLSAWDFLEEYMKIHEKREKGGKKDSPTYIQDLVAGRPVLGHPSRSGAFRLVYGRTRCSGYSALSIHPATMAVLEDFIAIGTQLKTELPTKGAAITVCDSIEGPIVKLKDGGVKKIKTMGQAKELKGKIEEIIYLGDILIPYGDFVNRNHILMPSGFEEKQWLEEIKEKNLKPEESFEKKIELCEKGVSLHPDYIYFWSQIDYHDFLAFLDWLSHSQIKERKLIFPYNKTTWERFRKGKRVLEILGVEHEVAIENVVLDEKETKAFLLNLGIEGENLAEEVEEISKKIRQQENVLDVVNQLCKYNIKDKAGTFIGARMGRPEKAKLRKLVGSPNVLFPIGQEGGRLRSVFEACEYGSVKADFPIYYCSRCGQETIYYICESCGERTEKLNYCPECQQKFAMEKCPQHNLGQKFNSRRIDIKHFFDSAMKKLGVEKNDVPAMIKGVRGTSSADHVPENLAKGILRAKYKLNVNKDGTIRFDATELPITQFKPKEIFVNMEKLKGMGYIKDIKGKELENEEQVLELKPHDIILPCCPETLDEKADDVFLRISKFIDSLLENFYGLKKFYNVNDRGDLVGHLVACIAPHNCACVVGRIIGFSKTQSLLASPYMHAAMRRDCVYPETKIFFYNKDNKEIFYDEIGNYVEKLIKEGAEIKKIDAFGTLAVENKKELYALGIDPLTHELKKKKIKYFIKGPETKEWIKITTATNREYVMTPTHKFMHIEEGKFKFKEAKEIQIDDGLPILGNFNFEFKEESINLIDLFKKKLNEKEQKEIWVVNNKGKEELSSFNKKIDNSINLRWKFSKHLIPAILRIDKDFLRILGYYAAEGYSRTNKTISQVSFRICNKEIQENLTELAKKVFGIKVNLGEENTKITVCSKLVYYILKSLGCGQGAYDKRVPNFIFSLNKELVAEYVSAFFEGDGSIIRSLRRIVFYSVSRNLLDDIALLLTKFGVIGRYFRTGLRVPGKKVLERYKELGKEPKKHILNHLILGVHDSFNVSKFLNIVNKEKANEILVLKPCEKRYIHYNKKRVLLEAQSDYLIDYVKKVETIKETKNSYCVEIEWRDIEDRNILWGEQIINTRCDGDEAAVILLLDMLLNFSRHYLPAHRGGTQDAPLVLNARIRAGEVDDMIFDVDVQKEYPLALYKAGENFEHPSKVKIEQIKDRLGKEEFTNLRYTHETSDINYGVLCSAYKKLATMQEKVEKQMQLVERIRAVNTGDVARLVIDRHFIRDIKGNLRKFSQQVFRCVKCNEKYRRPPLDGKCSKCQGRIIFTISEGGIIKYLEPALSLAENYDVPPYVKQNLELTKKYIESIFGRETEKQEALGKWFS